MPSAAPIRVRLRQRHAALVASILLGTLLVYLVGNNLFPLLDRDEPRFAQASKQMLESGDWTTPRFLDELRLNKPILIYWLQATAMRWFDPTPAAARFPSSIAAVLTLAVFALALPSTIGHRRTVWMLFIFATALMPAYLAKVCMADAVQHLFIAVSMLCLYRVWQLAAGWATLTVMGVAIGLAVLTKGPPVLMYLGMTLVALWALNKTLELPGSVTPIVVEDAVPRVFMRIAFVFAIAFVVCLPWAISMERARAGTLAAMFSNEIVSRGATAKEGHSGPPGFYAVSFWLTYFPWCLFWPAALVHGWKRRHLPWVRFSLAAVLGPWLFLEIYKTKLPHYWLPSYPFMAILTSDALIRGMRARIVDFRDRPFLIGAAAWAGAASVVAVLFVALPVFGDRAWATPVVSIPFAIGLVVFAWGVVALLQQRRLELAAITMGVGTIALILFGACAYLPRVPTFTLPQRVAGELRTIGAITPGEVQMIGFKEPSLAFYQGGTIREQSDDTFLTTTPPERWPIWTVIDDASWKKTLALSPNITTKLIPRATLKGAAYADGEWPVIVHVLEKKIAPTTMP